jgi:hypothetical protein
MTGCARIHKNTKWTEQVQFKNIISFPHRVLKVTINPLHAADDKNVSHV